MLAAELLPLLEAQARERQLATLKQNVAHSVPQKIGERTVNSGTDEISVDPQVTASAPSVKTFTDGVASEEPPRRGSRKRHRR
jgi:hypothetical protein